MTETRTRVCPSTGKPTTRQVEWDTDAQAYVSIDTCPDCGAMFTVFTDE